MISFSLYLVEGSNIQLNPAYGHPLNTGKNSLLCPWKKIQPASYGHPVNKDTLYDSLSICPCSDLRRFHSCLAWNSSDCFESFSPLNSYWGSNNDSK